MWQFIDLSAEQKTLRRERLDWYATVAFVSAIIPLAWIQLSVLARWFLQWHASNKAQHIPPSSPYVKQLRLEQRLDLSQKLRRASWWCGDEVHIGAWHLGTRGEVLGAGAWLAWLFSLCILDTGIDYLHLTKRFGIVAASQLPWHYLLSMKSPWSPLQAITRRSHESLIAIHQLVGRIITVLLYGHAVLYLNFYVQNGLLLEKLTQFYVLCGIFGIVSLTVIGTSALETIRQRSYNKFYIIHVTLATALLPVLYFHVSHIRMYLWETLAVYALNIILRFMATNARTGTITRIPDTNLIDISIPLSGETGRKPRFEPGQHAYISLPGHPLSRTFRSNPFTVASLPAIDGQLRFVARILDGNTANLAQTSRSTQRLSIEGPYGLRTHSETLLSYDRVLFIAGGIGATFIVPLYRQLLADLSPSRGSQRRQRVRFIWVARTMAEVSWALPQDQQENKGFAERLTIHLTQDRTIPTTSKPAEEPHEVEEDEEDFSIGNDDEQHTPLAPLQDDHGIELQNHPTNATNTSKPQQQPLLSIRPGRPDVPRIVEQAFSHSSADRVAILVCGPRGLSRRVRNETRRWVGSGRDVFFWDEAFAL